MDFGLELAPYVLDLVSKLTPHILNSVMEHVPYALNFRCQFPLGDQDVFTGGEVAAGILSN
ncbi:MAG TPA: hypothetical protein VGN43_11960 [Steroidobacteraceae bacterium]|nr:hypothetical protein [Steroidobacteraceae bacterium]